VKPPSLVVVRARGPCAIQDAGRPGHMHEGVPPGGALVPELHARANALAGNAPGAAALELFAELTIAARGGPLTIACDDGTTRTLADGESFTASPTSARVAYLAVAGGLATPLYLGSRSALPLAGLGAWLRAGDTLTLERFHRETGRKGGFDLGVASQNPNPSPSPRLPVKIFPGPDGHRFAPDALAVLLATAWAISATSDRVGIRLDGPARIPRADADDARSAPMVRGAIQVPAGGAPVVLGPDHPTTGGYPVIAVIPSTAFGALAALRPGETVRFAT
jgi:biotin-dependent carboxylase-like uncharacterized protein